MSGSATTRIRQQLADRVSEILRLIDETSSEPGHLHDLRVACRRLLVARPLLDSGKKDVPRNWISVLEAFLDHSGEVRDAHVFCHWCRSKRLPEPALDAENARLRRLYDALRRERETLQSSLDRAVQHAKPGPAVIANLWQSAEQRFRRRLRQLHRDDPRAFHRFRVALKKLRYVVELLNDLGQVEVEQARGFGEWQDRLGELQDIQVILARIDEPALRDQLQRNSEQLMRDLFDSLGDLVRSVDQLNAQIQN